MSFLHTCTLELRLCPTTRASDFLTVMDLLAPVFLPCALSYTLGDAEIRSNSTEQVGSLWEGEARHAGFLTSYTTGAEQHLVSDCAPAVRAYDGDKFWFSAIGPVQHRAPDTDEAAWYGRWQASDGGLYELMHVRAEFGAFPISELEVIFPLLGYPLTTSRLEGNRVVAGDPQAAEDNREALLSLLAQVPAAMQQTTTWNVAGEASFDYPDDIARVKARLAR